MKSVQTNELTSRLPDQFAPADAIFEMCSCDQPLANFSEWVQFSSKMEKNIAVVVTKSRSALLHMSGKRKFKFNIILSVVCIKICRYIENNKTSYSLANNLYSAPLNNEV